MVFLCSILLKLIFFLRYPKCIGFLVNFDSHDFSAKLPKPRIDGERSYVIRGETIELACYEQGVDSLAYYIWQHNGEVE